MCMNGELNDLDVNVSVKKAYKMSPQVLNVYMNGWMGEIKTEEGELCHRVRV